jgi:soluble lytic murein transglycosylase-like protein
LRKTASWAPTAGLITAIVTLAALPAHACWDEAAARYGVSSELLYAIARTESALDPQAVGRNRNGTRDIGLMQINSAWLPTLAAHGIGERDLFDPCTSIHVGAWILAGNVQRLGYTWDAVGAYNAANPACAAPTSTRSAATCAAPVRQRISRSPRRHPYRRHPRRPPSTGGRNPALTARPSTSPSTQPRDTTP